MVGTVVFLAERGQLTGARVVAREGSRYVLENLIGERFAVAQSRLFWIGRSAAPTQEALVAWWDEVGRLATQADLPRAWQAIEAQHLPCEPAIVAVRAFAVSPADPTRVTLAEEALALAVFADTTHFRVRERHLQRASAAEVAETLRKRAEKEAAQRALQQAVDVFKTALDGVPMSQVAREQVAEYRTALLDVAANGREAAGWAKASLLCEALGLLADKAFDLLVRLGELDPNTNLAVHRAGIPLAFTAEELAEADRLATHRPSPSVDLSELEAIAIDDADTTDVDDALALAGERVYVIISDAAAWIPAGSLLDRAAAERATTVYLPEGKLPMVPQVLSDGTLSLLPEGPRFALVFSFELAPDGRLERLEMKRAKVKIARRVSYEEADRLLVDPASGHFGPLLVKLQALADRHRRWRHARGAVSFQRPEVYFELDREKRVIVKYGDPFGAARQLVQELMIAACTGAAIFCAENQIPCIYRAQSPPDDPPRAGEIKDGRIEDPHLQYELLRKLKPSTLQLEVAPHWTLGVPAYTQVTSPIRRYADLLMHQQLATFMKTGRPLYPASKLQAHLFELGRRAALARRVEQESRRFYALRYLEQNPGQILTGTVLREIGKKSLLELAPLALTELVQLRRRRAPGTTLRLEVIAADARADTVQLKELAG